MPNLFTFRDYVVFFWAGDGEGPIHVHASLGVPSPVSAKLWLTEDGAAVLASNAPVLSGKDVRRLSRVISANYERVCKRWEQMFGVKPSFYL